ncbi:MAG: Fimbrial protein pilin [Candidatus Daviesbacteria bacterium GW2011_GWA1_41_61]|uniref:Fimbrial protein pilin n=1 Tax=Candidatus Daviesbacteria bacterium GW2011_GWA2_40_9 TaxID=1618424 RepID=A0A0G0X7Q9_9BACT|nr:MAG: Fimbrial protein pilin [Candidatus Daviesbacteria bacterium GW2011_GWC1_40_9]KKR83667.1 MAG: Fimbrial protein pilin [Candidatus Daviesbacteria bacterium GW2011_GWA2_40_9]KKR92674.1 MAG: Fimbrial protein pilin [Candidatus Daviesbacteria bacterium GW2011_GWB1_41_15]KKS14605.1 MAG: Fimbrial protein pilin [Candidatus Daviesbacteria bacterium GW2011_GWA1_41_61]
MLKSTAGFTIIELLVVISILAILSTIGFLSYFNTINKTTTTIVKADFVSIYKSIAIARLAKQKTFGQITQNFCSECASCRASPNVSLDQACIDDLTASWQTISSDLLPRDPWGNPYLWDENELEGGNCNRDSLRTVGADHLYGTADDIVSYVPRYICTPP